MERVLWESKVYVDGTPVAIRESLVGIHEYKLSEMLTPGTHVITPADADKQMAHGYTNHTQIKWNGILGTVALRASEKSIPETFKSILMYLTVLNTQNPTEVH